MGFRMAAAILVPVLAVAAADAQPARPGGDQSAQAVQQQPGRRDTPPRDAAANQIGTARIRGRIVAADTGAPVRRAQVTVNSSELRFRRVTTTDADGRYDFRDLPAGRYQLTANKAGFVSLQYGQRRPFEAGRPLEMADGQLLEKVDFLLPRGGVVTGRVVDEFGEPMADAMVQAMQYRFVAGRKRMTPAGRGMQTNDLGQFRIYGLPPGEYFVSATLRGMGVFGEPQEDQREQVGYAPTYYPGTAALSDAQLVTVNIAQETSNVDFPLLAVRTARISGLVVDSQGQQASSGSVMLMSFDAAGGPIMPSPIRNGQFTVSSVSPGDYRLMVRATPAADAEADMIGMFDPRTQRRSELAVQPVTVTGQDITGLVITTSKGATVSGRVTFEGTAPTKIEKLGVTAISADPDLMSMGAVGGLLKEDGSFVLSGLIGRVYIRPSVPSGWTLKSAQTGTTDITDTPLTLKGNEEITGVEIVLTSRISEISGSATDDKGKAVTDYTVVVFADDPERWTFQSRHIRAERPDQEGHFRLRALPPGSYQAVALEYLQPGQAGDPEFLERLRAHATRVTLDEGEKTTVQLKLRRID